MVRVVAKWSEHNVRLFVCLCRCVLGELFAARLNPDAERGPVFKGEGKGDPGAASQLRAIAGLCGRPTASVWPQVARMPRYADIPFLHSYEALPRRVQEEYKGSVQGVSGKIDAV